MLSPFPSRRLSLTPTCTIRLQAARFGRCALSMPGTTDGYIRWKCNPWVATRAVPKSVAAGNGSTHSEQRGAHLPGDR